MPATRASRASRRTSASTRAGRSSSRSTRRRRTTGSTSTGSASTAATARARSRRSSRRRRCRRRNPSCLVTGGTLPDNLVDCGNWGVSASWSVPTDAVSGIYIARPVREDVGGDLASHIAVHRPRRRRRLRSAVPDLGHDLAGVQPLRRLQPLRRARARPQGQLQPPVHDARRADRGLALQCRVPDAALARAQRLRRQLLHRRRLRLGAARRSSSTRPSCRSATTSTGRPGSARTWRRPATPASNLAFFSGNEIYWKTRWEPSTADGGEHRLPDARLVQGGRRPGLRALRLRRRTSTAIPTRTRWTGLWRQNQTGPRRRAARERAERPDQLGRHDDRHRGPGLRHRPALLAQHRHDRRDDADRRTRSATRSTGSRRRTPAPIRPAGSRCPTRTAAGKNHRMSLYRAPSGALVFGAGTVQWSWGLDDTHDRGVVDRGPADAAGHGQHPLRHGRPARDAPGRPGRRAVRSTRQRPPRPSPTRRAARPSRAATSRSPAPPPTPAASSPRSRSRPTAARPGPAPPARRTGPTPSAHPTAR